MVLIFLRLWVSEVISQWPAGHWVVEGAGWLPLTGLVAWGSCGVLQGAIQVWCMSPLLGQCGACHHCWGSVVQAVVHVTTVEAVWCRLGSTIPNLRWQMQPHNAWSLLQILHRFSQRHWPWKWLATWLWKWDWFHDDRSTGEESPAAEVSVVIQGCVPYSVTELACWGVDNHVQHCSGAPVEGCTMTQSRGMAVQYPSRKLSLCVGRQWRTTPHSCPKETSWRVVLTAQSTLWNSKSPMPEISTFSSSYSHNTTS